MSLTVHINKTKHHLSTTVAPSRTHILVATATVSSSSSWNASKRDIFISLVLKPEDIFQFMTCFCPHDTFQIYHIRFPSYSFCFICFLFSIFFSLSINSPSVVPLKQVELRTRILHSLKRGVLKRDVNETFKRIVIFQEY